MAVVELKHCMACGCELSIARGDRRQWYSEVSLRCFECNYAKTVRQIYGQSDNGERLFALDAGQDMLARVHVAEARMAEFTKKMDDALDKLYAKSRKAWCPRHQRDKETP